MATHDYVIANASGAAVRSDLNNALAAIVSNNSNTTEPATTYAYQSWADTTAGLMKIRNSTNDAWVSLFNLDGSSLGPGKVTFGATEVVFNDAGNDVDFRIEGDTEANLFFVDASADKIGIGNNSPTAKLDIAHGNELGIYTSGPFNFQAKFESTDSEAAIVIEDSNSTNDGNRIGVIGDNMEFTTAGLPRARIDSSGHLIVGGATAGNAGTVTVSIGNPGATNGGLQLWSTTTGSSYVQFGDSSASASDHYRGAIGYQHDTDQMIVYTAGSERMRITSGGYLKVSNSGSYFNSAGSYHEFTNTANVPALITRATNASQTDTVVSISPVRAASSAYKMLVAYSGNETDVEFNLRGDGTGYSDGGWTTPASDYAEYFEWEDGNPDNEDRRGVSVVLDGTTIREAVAGEEPLGIISARPSIVGDAATERWKEKYLTDDFGSYIVEPHNVVSWTDEDGKEHEYEDFNMPEDILIPDDAVIATADENGVPFTHRKLNPDYDPNQAYVSREHRPEWDTVGLLGKLRMRKGQVTGSRWIKMRDISDSVEEWLVR